MGRSAPCVPFDPVTDGNTDMCESWHESYPPLLHCDYWNGRYWTVSIEGSGDFPLEVRLYRFPGYDAPGELVAIQENTWEVS